MNITATLAEVVRTMQIAGQCVLAIPVIIGALLLFAERRRARRMELMYTDTDSTPDSDSLHI